MYVWKKRNKKLSYCTYVCMCVFVAMNTDKHGNLHKRSLWQHKFRILRKLYANPVIPASFGSIESLYQSAKGSQPKVSISRNDVRKFLATQVAYMKHGNPKYRFKKRDLTLSYGYMELLQADLCEMQTFYRQNNGIHYLLVVVDVLSNFMWVHTMKSKKIKDVLPAMEYMLMTAFGNNYGLSDASSVKTYRHLQMDHGTEFNSAGFQQLMNKYQMKQFSSFSSDVKASVGELSITNISILFYIIFFSTFHFS